jgi:SAM-dependent methyltransferase
MVLNTLLRAAGDAAYRLGLGPRPSNVPDHTLVELVEGHGRLAPGRALDLGCGTGRNALYLAGHGWETVGVDMVGYAVEVARRRAAAQSLSIQFYQGDVTRLSELAVGTGFGLLMDGGCYHMIPADRRDAYVQSATRAAAPGAHLIMVGFSRTLGAGRHPEHLLARLRGRSLVRVDPVPGEQMSQYVSAPAPLRAALKAGAFHPLRYEPQRA